jgi:hypothetical protein
MWSQIFFKNDLPNNYLEFKQQPANTGIHDLLTK